MGSMSPNMIEECFIFSATSLQSKKQPHDHKNPNDSKNIDGFDIVITYMIEKQKKNFYG